MRSFLFVLAGLAVMGLAFWSYQENYKTRDALSEVRNLHAQIGRNHERLGMLRAEWAYLNRPDRLSDLAELNFDRLGLLPIMPDAFGRVDQIIYPLPDVLPIIVPIEVDSAPVNLDEDAL
ncbi:MAG: cell division protein FtsL [Yoonia sp.]|nr:cell division protein FtsL [Yoonia sp.]